MCDGLEYIHKEGYQHFDLNPKNILIVDNSIRIGDFSHCFKISKGTAYKHLIGTYQFMDRKYLKRVNAQELRIYTRWV